MVELLQKHEGVGRCGPGLEFGTEAPANILQILPHFCILDHSGSSKRRPRPRPLRSACGSGRWCWRSRRSWPRRGQGGRRRWSGRLNLKFRRAKRRGQRRHVAALSPWGSEGGAGRDRGCLRWPSMALSLVTAHGVGRLGRQAEQRERALAAAAAEIKLWKDCAMHPLRSSTHCTCSFCTSTVLSWCGSSSSICYWPLLLLLALRCSCSPLCHSVVAPHAALLTSRPPRASQARRRSKAGWRWRRRSSSA